MIAESRHIGTMRMMASGKNRLSYFAASTRNTNSTQIGNTRIAVLPAISCWKVSSVHSNAMPLGRVSARMRVIACCAWPLE
jgi:hypothetical protein